MVEPLTYDEYTDAFEKLLAAASAKATSKVVIVDCSALGPVPKPPEALTYHKAELISVLADETPEQIATNPVDLGPTCRKCSAPFEYEKGKKGRRPVLCPRCKADALNAELGAAKTEPVALVCGCGAVLIRKSTKGKPPKYCEKCKAERAAQVADEKKYGATVNSGLPDPFGG